MELFTRLTFNENEWIVPSGHPWSKDKQGNPGVSYENQHGFGHEEWLLNPRYNIAGWQYGYIRGLRRVHEKVDRVYLYSVNKDNGKNYIYYLGFLNNVEILDDNWGIKFPIVKKVFNDYSPMVIEEVAQTNGNSLAFKQDPFIPVIRFNKDGNSLLDKPRLLDFFPLNRYKRFQPYQLTDEILKLFTHGIASKKDFEFRFTPGKASQTERFNRYVGPSSKAVIKKHCKIIDALENFLQPDYSIKKKNISIERTRFNGNIADLVTLKSDKSAIIYEIKTSLNLRKNIREALGQLLDYASHGGNFEVSKLVIVSPCKLDDEGQLFLKSLRKAIRYPIDYFEYSEVSDKKFIKSN